MWAVFDRLLDCLLLWLMTLSFLHEFFLGLWSYLLTEGICSTSYSSIRTYSSSFLLASASWLVLLLIIEDTLLIPRLSLLFDTFDSALEFIDLISEFSGDFSSQTLEDLTTLDSRLFYSTIDTLKTFWLWIELITIEWVSCLFLQIFIMNWQKNFIIDQTSQLIYRKRNVTQLL